MLRMGERSDEPEESFTHEFVNLSIILNNVLTVSYSGNGGNTGYFNNFFKSYRALRIA